jgi:hypothetical protein
MNEPSPVDCNQLTQALDVLTVKEIVRAAKAHSFQFSLAEKCRRATLISSIKSFPPLHQIIIAASAEKMSRGAEENIRLLKRARLTENDSASDVCPDFLQDVGDDIRNCRLARFIDHTNNDTIKQVICVVCASEVFATEAPIIELLSLKSKKLLKPASHHHTQELIMGMLLHNPSVVSREGASFGHVCTECMTDLASAKLPRFALANALWVGEVPFELSVLTLPERILIALYYPAAYIVKLYPKQKGAQYWDPSTINSGLRGNVSSYHLNTTNITAMIEGHIRPPSPAVLAALIGVTIIGPKNLPDRCLPSFLTVNRHRVHQALLFLKRENPLYRDISISLLNLDLLPTSGVPDEIMVGIRHTDDTTALDEERAGYVITDDDEHISSTCGEFSKNCSET